MSDVNVNNFDSLVESVQQIKTELIGDPEKKRKKEISDKWLQISTTVIAVASFVITIYNIAVTEPRNAAAQKETQAYQFWLSYLKLAAEHPKLANGLDSIDGHPVDSIASRNTKMYAARFEDTTVQKFVDYAWFVANALGAAEYVSGLTSKDKSWGETVDTIVYSHITYISSEGFDRQQYDTCMRERFARLTRVAIDNKKKLCCMKK